ncbi:YraN family protein [Flavobacteriaceae bacterium R38]|nr:YraN family protein [Flavobacteriaceae bacterium R38]
MASHNDFGKKAEELACDFLIRKGFQIVARNYRFDKAEIDIIAQKGTFLSIVEVKARTNVSFGNPESFVSKKKIQLLVKAANHYVIENELDVEVRFDIISIINKKNTYSIDFIENSFFHF